MASIDNRIVQMKFDNSSFESKLGTTLSSLDKLKASLKFKGATEGLNNVSAEASKLSSLGINGIGSAVSTVAEKFNYMRVVAVTALSNVVNRAIAAGTSIVKSLTITPISMGFKEYETNMRSIQTIMSNTKDTSLVQVKDALDELNIYSDKTIYNFGQMAKNIGTFTAAGVNLDTSVTSIKGIANLAAISGSSAEQASNAMYQLSQAVASGTVKLIDWNSVVNAGMGGQVFQEALYETGKALGTLKNVPLTKTFDEWKKGGKTFRNSLQEGWVTSEVLTTTLKGFTGELNEAQIVALGYTKEQAKAVMQLGIDGVEAATKVRTFTQLLETSREAVGSGWSKTFRIILGDFESATVLFTDLSSAFGGMINKSADARNELLESWSKMGGRTQLIDALTSAAKALMTVIGTLKKAFGEVFPPMTAVTLTKLTWAFNDFTKKLMPSKKALNILSSVFRGVFSVISIGVTIVKSIASSFITLFKALSKSSGVGNTLTAIKSLTDGLYALKVFLVDGNRIAKFFDSITKSILRFAKDPVAELKHLKEVAGEVFSRLLTTIASLNFLPSGLTKWLLSVRDSFASAFGTIGNVAERANTHFNVLKDGITSLKETFQPVIDAFKRFSDYISTWFKELGAKMSSAAAPGDFSKVLDAVNLGIIAAIGTMLGIISGGGIDFTNFFDGFRKTLKDFSGVLEGMQMQLKADALLKIALAITVLAVALVIMASIPSADLTKALTAAATGLAMLMLAMKQISLITGPKGAAAFAIASAGLIAMSAALLLMAFAVKSLSKLSPAELSKGLIGMTIILGVLVAAVKILDGHTAGMIRAGVALIAVSVGMIILAGAIALFALMSWEDIAKGVVAIAASLLAIGVALNLMPWNSLSKAVGLVLVAVALNILAAAVMIFSSMSLGELAKGIGAIAISLFVIALAMHAMPLTLPLTAAGLLLVSISLAIIAGVIKSLGSLSWEQIAKGLVAIAGAMIILALGAYAMSGAIPGAIALAIMAVSIVLIAGALKKLGELTWGEIIKGLVAIAAAVALLALAGMLVAPALGPMLGLAAALLLIGAAVGLFGVGIFLLGKGLQAVIDILTVNIDWIIGLLDKLLERIPFLAKMLVIALVEVVMIIIEALPVIIEQLVIILSHIIDGFIELIPKLTVLVIALIDAIILIVAEKGPDIIEAGANLLINFINGIADNAEDFVDAIVNLITSFLNAVTERLPLILASAVALFREFVAGVVLYISEVATAVGTIIVAFITELGIQTQRIINAGVKLLTDFLSGIANNIIKITDAVTLVVTTFITAITNSAVKIAAAGADSLVQFLKGISDNISKIGTAVGDLITKFINTVKDNGTRIITAGTDAIVAFIQGLGNAATRIAVAAVTAVTDFVKALDKAIEDNVDDFTAAGRSIAWNIVNGMTLGLAGKVKDAVSGAINLGKSLVKGIGGFLGINSPSKVFIGIGNSIVEGLEMGLDESAPSERSAIGLAERTNAAFTKTLENLAYSLEITDTFNPTIEPVLDLTGVRNGAKEIKNLMGISENIGTTVAFKQAQNIASTEAPISSETMPITSNEVNFQQNIYSPSALSVADVYRQTKNQINMAKEELNIP